MNEPPSSKPVIGKNGKRTEEDWMGIVDRALVAVAGKGNPTEDAVFFAKLALEYAHDTRDFRQAVTQITELQDKLNAWVKKDRKSRGIDE